MIVTIRISGESEPYHIVESGIACPYSVAAFNFTSYTWASNMPNTLVPDVKNEDKLNIISLASICENCLTQLHDKFSRMVGGDKWLKA